MGENIVPLFLNSKLSFELLLYHSWVFMVEGKSIRQQMKDERSTGNGVMEGQVGESERERGGGGNKSINGP